MCFNNAFLALHPVQPPAFLEEEPALAVARTSFFNLSWAFSRVEEFTKVDCTRTHYHSEEGVGR